MKKQSKESSIISTLAMVGNELKFINLGLCKLKVKINKQHYLRSFYACRRNKYLFINLWYFYLTFWR